MSTKASDYTWKSVLGGLGPSRFWPVLYWTQAEYESGACKDAYKLEPVTAQDLPAIKQLLEAQNCGN